MMIQNLTIPKLQQLLEVIAKADRQVNPFIAGGAIRDLVLGRPIKDIDIFICNNTPSLDEYALDDGWFDDSRVLTALEEHLYCKPTRIGGSDNPKAYANCFSVHEFPTGLHMTPVQVISCHKTKAETIADFDFGLCQIWLDQQRIGTTKAFERDRQGYLTYMGAILGAGDLEHLGRLRKKYPTHRLQNCGALLSLPVLMTKGEA